MNSIGGTLWDSTRANPLTWHKHRNRLESLFPIVPSALQAHYIARQVSFCAAFVRASICHRTHYVNPASTENSQAMCC